MMNKKLIFQLSSFGVGMGIATINLIPPKAEPVFWLVIFVFCAIVIAKKCYSKFFLHGFLVSMLNSVWITLIHILFYDQYIENHPQELLMMENFPLPYSMRIAMLMMGPVIGVMSGIVLGLFSLIASKIIKRKRSSSIN